MVYQVGTSRLCTGPTVSSRGPTLAVRGPPAGHLRVLPALDGVCHFRHGLDPYLPDGIQRYRYKTGSGFGGI